MDISAERRGFVRGAGTALGVTAAVGGIVALYGMKKSWDPLPGVAAAGLTEVDVAGMKPGDTRRVVYRGKPVFILRKSHDMPDDDKRDVIIDGDRYTVIILICTHLGCIPNWEPDKEIFLCACHGGKYNSSGINIFGPPPKPMVIPEFRLDGGTKLTLGKTGPEYKKLSVG